MPYVEGESLRERLARELQLPLDDALRIAGQVPQRWAMPTHAASSTATSSRRTSCSTAARRVVADFGIARASRAAGSERLTETGLALGTPAYMSPEQAAAGRSVDGRSDLYAFGCVIYEMLAGQPPFTGPTPQGLLARHALDPVPPLRTVRDTVPVAVEQSVMRAMAKAPADRFPTAAAFAEGLTAPRSPAPFR